MDPLLKLLRENAALKPAQLASLLGVSADGKHVYTAEPAHFYKAETALFVWDAATGRLHAKHSLGRDSEGIQAIGFGPEGVRVLDRIDSGWQYRQRVINPQTGATVRFVENVDLLAEVGGVGGLLRFRI